MCCSTCLTVSLVPGGTAGGTAQECVASFKHRLAWQHSIYVVVEINGLHVWTLLFLYLHCHLDLVVCFGVMLVTVTLYGLWEVRCILCMCMSCFYCWYFFYSETFFPTPLKIVSNDFGG